jgi:hypothetical protein
MPKIPIKIIKDKLSADKVTNDLKVDLRQKPETEPEQPSRKWLFLSIFLILAILGLTTIWFLFSSQKLAFVDLVPKEAVVFSLINQTALYEQTFPFSQFLRERGFYGQKAIAKMGEYLNQAELNFKKDIEPLFKKPMAFILMPANSETPFPFLLLFERKAPSAHINQLLDKIEPILKRDYNFSSQVYRQIEVTVLKSLFSPPAGVPDSYAYAQIEDYFIISNSQEAIEKVIDLIIGK